MIVKLVPRELGKDSSISWMRSVVAVVLGSDECWIVSWPEELKTKLSEASCASERGPVSSHCDVGTAWSAKLSRKGELAIVASFDGEVLSIALEACLK